jgi:UDP-glucose 4-epimerase
MNVLVTGGAGFIGRWLVKKLLENENRVWVIDNLSNAKPGNIDEFTGNSNFNFIRADIRNNRLLKILFKNNFNIIFHLAASVIVQNSLDDPRRSFENDLVSTFNLLELSRDYGSKFIYMSSCMVYDKAVNKEGISEKHPLKPASPYAGVKISGETMSLSYYYSYNLPVVILRPFNTYGPYQKSNNEGGVISIFIQNKIKNKKLRIYGDGKQTRDFMYVEDCADFIYKAANSEKAIGEIINAGYGRDISINKLALMIASSEKDIEHIEHIHPQSEINKLLSNNRKAKILLGWEPVIDLEEGIRRTEEWLRRVKIE